MDIRQCYLTSNDCYERNTIKADSRYTTFQHRGPLGIMVHSTGANNPSLRRYVAPDDGLIGTNYYNNHWNKSGLEVCVHAFIGQDKNGTVRCYQTLPWNYRAWHCGDEANNTHVAFEICEDDLQDQDYFQATYQMAVSLTAHICKLYRLNPLADGVIISHAEGARRGIASNHSDVGHWWGRFGVTMDDFRRDVSRSMDAEKSPVYRVRRSWADKDSQLGAYTDLNNAKAACPVGYSVFDKDGKVVYQNLEEEINMTKVEMEALVRDQVDKAVEKSVGKYYNKLGEVTQPSYRPMLDKLIAKGYLKGRSGNGGNLVLDMYESNIRALVIVGRALEAAGLLD